MTIDNALTSALMVQLIASFFAPPIPVGGHLLFAADLWAFVWIWSFALVLLWKSDSAERRRLCASIAAIIAVVALVFVHGLNRESLAPALRRFIDAPVDDLFSPGREAVIAFRFITWSVGTIVVARRAIGVDRISKVLNACVLGAVAAMILACLSPAVRTTLGSLYRYDPDTPNWADRAFGIFQSPIEACATYSLALLFLLQERIGKNGKIVLITTLLIGIGLTKTLTSFVAALIAIAFPIVRAMPRTRRRILISGGVVAAATLLVAFWNAPFFALKRGNLMFRMKPWNVYWEAGLAHPDRFLLGNGFIPHFSDNIWVFFFSRGGAFLVAIALSLLIVGWKRYGHRLTSPQWTIAIFFLVAGMAIDILILRPIIYLMLALGIGLLKPRPSS